MKAVNQRVRDLTDEEIQSYLTDGSLSLDIEGQAIVLGADDLEISSEGVEGWLVGQEAGVTVALDTEIDDSLKAEGLARETVNRLQNMRQQEIGRASCRETSEQTR